LPTDGLCGFRRPNPFRHYEGTLAVNQSIASHSPHNCAAASARRFDAGLRVLIRRMSIENWLWGAPRIHGEFFFVLIHVSAALYHHFIRGDSVLKRMLPRAMGGF
jgi:hypothetical protein